MPCPVCAHALVAEIDANPERQSLRQLETRYDLSRSSLHRHQQRCQQAAGPAGDAGEPVSPAPVRNPLGQYHGETLQLYAALNDHRQPVDMRGALAAVVGLLMRMTDPGER